MEVEQLYGDPVRKVNGKSQGTHTQENPASFNETQIKPEAN